MKKINLYNLYLGIAIIVLIVISSISFYFVMRETVSQKYISNETYLSMFYNNYISPDCSYGEKGRITDEKVLSECREKFKTKLLEKREYRYEFNIIKYGVLLAIVLGLLSIHSVLFIIRKKK